MAAALKNQKHARKTLMNISDIAKVLRDAGHPMSAQAILNAGNGIGSWSHIHALINADIEGKGRASKFVRHGGKYALRK